MSPGSCARVRRVLVGAGLCIMWGELKSGAWGVVINDRLYVVANAEDCDRAPDPRDVTFCVYTRSADDEWTDSYEEPETTLRAVLERLDALRAAELDRQLGFEPTTENMPDDDPYVCAECGGEDVQHSMWVTLNTNEVHEEAGTWNYDGNTWCPDCSAPTRIISKSEYLARKAG